MGTRRTAWQTVQTSLKATSRSLRESDHQKDVIGSGIAIKGIGLFKFRLEDDDGQVYIIRVPNLFYVPSFKRVFLAPHH